MSTLRGFRMTSGAPLRLLTADFVERDLRRRAEAVMARARTQSPFLSGQLRGSLRVTTRRTRDRVVVRVVASTPYAAIVASRDPFLARALEAGR